MRTGVERLLLAIGATMFLAACGQKDQPAATASSAPPAAAPVEAPAPAPESPDNAMTQYASERLGIYTPVRLSADLSHLSAGQREMIGLLIAASDIMDDLFWQQAYGDRDELLDAIDHADTREFARINYGPWDRLDGDRSFVSGVGEKPKGANFYPPDMTRAEFEAADLEGKSSLYSILRRDADGALRVLRYSEAYADELGRAAELLRQASQLAEDEDFAGYLRMRAAALLSDDYQPSDLAWMDMKSNPIDVVIGPIETYEDKLFGAKAAFESYVLIKDLEWSARLARYTDFLPALQEGLPVAAEYKAEVPGTDSDLNAYDVVYYAGDCNAGSKTIAINLPNDEQVQAQKGTRRLQLKNAMRAKFDEILVPISEVLIAEDQRKYITFDAFFANTMFHEVAHGLGIRNTLDGSGTVREALQDTASAIEEGKADILGLYMITRLHEQGELGDTTLEEYYVTFMASIFRSVRFGASSAHGRANMVRFNFFQDAGAFRRDPASGLYSIDMDAMQKAMTELSRKLLTLQGDGDYAGVQQLLAELGMVRPGLAADLQRLADAEIPVDVVFEQGAEVLGL
ncbi:MAG: Zn-dependent hydrolase [Chromatiales bacterium]|nr:MAG: Zn-dependent hydrolase [Chromatiales bacterium]